MMRGIAAMVIVGMMGCTSEVPEVELTVSEEPSPVAFDSCDASKHANLIGQPEAASSEIEAPKRVIGPDTIYTHDYIDRRINIVVDGQGVITGFWCG